MKKLFCNLFVAVAAMCMMSSCSNEESSNIIADINNNHCISIEEALSNLSAVMDDNDTRVGGTSKVVINVLPITTSMTRSGSSSNSALLYVANFEDNQGYALLAADDRIEEKVLAIVDSTNLSEEEIEEAASFSNDEKYIDPNYPMDGPGVFTMDEYPGETFLNPNTFSPYNEELDDYLIGDYSDESDSLSTRAVSTGPNSKNLALRISIDYAIDDVNDSPRGDSNNGYYSVVTYTDWCNNKVSKKLLRNYTHWNQGTPFNDLFPERRSLLIFGNKHKAPAGCFPLSIAKILTCLRWPSEYYINGVKLDWDALSNIYSDEGQYAAALLLWEIAHGCQSWYFYKGTFTFPCNAVSYMKEIGFQNAKEYGYDYNRVTAMIDKGCPVIISSIPGINIFSSHAWNIDGYKVKSRTKITNKYYNGKLIKTTEEQDTCKMVHCEFGWSGRNNNGYYVDGIFKLNSEDNEYDTINHSETYNYNHRVKIITY